MAIRRACAYGVAITTPEPPANYSSILVTFAQDQEILITKRRGDFEESDDGIFVKLTQEETLMFSPSVKSPMGARQSGKCYLQIRAFKDDFDAPGSQCWPIEVEDSLNEEVLSDA